MQLSNAPGKLVLPFANAGAKNTIPTASQIGIVAGAASLTDGFPPLTRTPLAAGGVPPSGLDMNGVLYDLSAILRWANAGGGYVYDGTFAADSNVGGYPKGARVLRSDGLGYWFNTTDNNATAPEGAGAVAAGWVPDFTNGIAAITMTSANVTLTPAQYGKPFVVLSGVLTANLNLIFPNLAGEWTVVNNCTGAFTVTVKTAAGTGAVVTPGRTRIIWGDGTKIAGAMNEVETATFGDSSTKLANTAFVAAAIAALSILQPGEISAFARNTAPTGYLKANGAAVSRTAYAALFSAIGTTFGTGDGSTTFNVPDLRGEFIRGWDDSRGVDSGRGFGSAQVASVESHTHDVKSSTTGAGGSAGDFVNGFGANRVATTAYGGTETRPRNIALLVCIKY